MHGPTAHTYIRQDINHSRDGLLERGLAGEVRAGRAHTAGRHEPAAVAAAVHTQCRHACLAASLRPHSEASSATSASAPLPLQAISSPVEPPAARAVHVVDLWVKCTPQKVAMPAHTARRAIHWMAGNTA